MTMRTRCKHRQGTMMLRTLSVVAPLLFVTACFPYVYHQQDRVLVRGIDVDATLEIARVELEDGGFGSTLTVWAIRDQIVTVDHAKTISELYFRYIDKVAAEILKAFDYSEHPDRFLYATDWPLAPMKDYRDFIAKVIPKPFHTEVFYANAKALFKL